MAGGTAYEIPLKLACFGLRRSEICALEPSDLDGTTLHITKALVYNKNHEWVTHVNKTTESKRYISIPAELADMIRTKNGRIYKGHPNQLHKYLSDKQKALGIEHLGFHKLRHFFASSLAAMNIPEADILKLGGWSRPDVMKTIYRHAQIDRNKQMREEVSTKLSSLIM